MSSSTSLSSARFRIAGSIPPNDVLERAQVGRLDHGLHPATGRDNLGSDLVASAVPVRSGGRPAGVTLVQKRPLAAARTPPAGCALGRESTNATIVLALPRGLLLRLPAHLPLDPPFLRLPIRRDSLRQPQPLRNLLQLVRHIRPLEVIQQGRVSDSVVGRQRPQ